MNWDQIEGQWKVMKGKARAQWGELTDDELDTAAGERERLVGLLQKRYGKSREAAQDEVDQWMKKVG